MFTISTDEYSKKLISCADEISALKLKEQILTRENFFVKENESHLGKLVDHLNKTNNDVHTKKEQHTKRDFDLTPMSKELVIFFILQRS